MPSVLQDTADGIEQTLLGPCSVSRGETCGELQDLGSPSSSRNGGNVPPTSSATVTRWIH
jgi:hypothetical protein